MPPADSRYERESGAGSGLGEVPHDFCLTADQGVAELKDAGIQCTLPTLNRWQNGSRPRKWADSIVKVGHLLAIKDLDGERRFSRRRISAFKRELLRGKGA